MSFFLVRKATMDVKTVDIYVLRSESDPHSLIHEPEKEKSMHVPERLISFL